MEPKLKVRPNMQTIHARKARMQDEPPTLPVERHIPRQYVAPVATRKRLQGLTGSDCKWPCDTSPEGILWFCGAPQAKGWVYCAAHGRIAYRQ